ncbi:MAG: response regulator [Pseudonocardiaceae bacterium]
MTARPAPIRVLVVDDQAMVRQGFSALLAAQPEIEVIGDAANGQDAVAAAAALTPDVVLMDIRMPVMDGIEATRRILTTSRNPLIRVLVLTTFDLDDYVYEALRAGASGFLLKDARAEDLVQAVRVVAGGDGLLAPSVTRRLDIRDRTQAVVVAYETGLVRPSDPRGHRSLPEHRGLTDAEPG